MAEQGLEPLVHHGDIRPYVAVYRRYYCEYREECDTFDDALRYLKYGEDYGELSSVAIMQGDEVLMDADTFHAMYINGAWPWGDSDDEDD